MPYTLISLLGVFSTSLLFAILAYWSIGHFAAGAGALAKWKVFTLTSVLSVLVILGLTWLLTKLHVQSSSNALNSWSRIFSYSLFAAALVSAASALVGAIGVAALWLKMRGK